MVDYCKPVSKDEVKEALKKVISDVPIAGSLTALLFRAADDKSFMMGNDGRVLANVKGDAVNYSVLFRYDKDSARLIIYKTPMDQVPTSDSGNVFCDEIAYISAGPKSAGVWAAGRGNLKTFGISVKVEKAVMLPSKHGVWFFDLMRWFAMMSGEFHLDASEQPKYWDGNLEYPG